MVADALPGHGPHNQNFIVMSKYRSDIKFTFKLCCVFPRLAHWIARLLAAMILIMYDNKQVLVSYMKRFQLLAPNQCGGMTEKANIFLCFLNWIQYNMSWCEVQLQWMWKSASVLANSHCWHATPHRKILFSLIVMLYRLWNHILHIHVLITN